MKTSSLYWKNKLDSLLPETFREEIAAFETDMDLRRRSKLEEKLFAEKRLRRGAYGQRYDNGERYDGVSVRKLLYPDSSSTKGPNTLWHAPGMLRIKIPFGGLNARQCEVLAELAEEYSDSIAHVTTRQDFQLHFIHIDDTPAIMRRLASVGITTREACGNSVRNITACPKAGCCQQELFDVSPYADALTYFLLGHHDVQDFGRKFKIAFSGCHGNACGLTNIHDLGLVAVERIIDGKKKRGFSFYVGGGLGAVPYPAKRMEEFIAEEELLPMAQSIARVFSRLGEKKNRARARVKFLIAKLGLDEFRRMVWEERKALPEDTRWTAYIDTLSTKQEQPLKPAQGLEQRATEDLPAHYHRWYRHNVQAQRQPNYCLVTIKLPLGDITAHQLRALADISRKYNKETLRTTVEQNIVLRWISQADLPDLYEDLHQAQLAEVGPGGITDIVACPGTDTCKLGISSSRGLAAELRKQFQTGEIEVDESIQDLHIKISGCFNSCAQHHISDLGFYGVSRKVGGHAVAHFQVVLGGQWEKNGGAYGLPIVAVPSRNIPKVVRRFAERYTKERLNEESFHSFTKRLGKAEAKKMLEDLTKVPAYDKGEKESLTYYSDWGDPREYSLGDMGVGECAGEIVSRVDMDLSAAERKIFEAQLLLEQEQGQKAGELAYAGMLEAARGLVKTSYLDVPSEAAIVIDEFRQRFCETKIFYDPYAGGKFASYLFSAFKKAPEKFSLETARQRIEEAGLFLEAAHKCNLKLASTAPVKANLTTK